MELVRGLGNLRPRHRGCVATIGNFDGVHRGHQAVIAQLQAAGTERGLPVVVIGFEPQPQEYFQPAAAPPRLTRWREKFEQLSARGVDRMICLRFDTALAALPARSFVGRVLVDACGVSHLVVGSDFRFGRGREGDYALLQALSVEHGFSISCATTFCVNGERVSSTRVRQALADGDLGLARRLLGRNYSISGRIAHGDKRGRALGFATANIDLHRRGTPVTGIFAALVYGLSQHGLPGVAYLGARPVIGGRYNVLEVHIFDFDRDCYGLHARVELLEKLRDDEHFNSFDTLRRQMTIDAENARQVLARVSAQGVL